MNWGLSALLTWGLTWAGGAQVPAREVCPDTAQIVRWTRLQLTEAGAPPDWIRVEASGHAQGPGHVLELTFVRGAQREQHVLEGRDCAALMSDAAVLVSLVLRSELGQWRVTPVDVRPPPVDARAPVEVQRPRHIEAAPMPPQQQREPPASPVTDEPPAPTTESPEIADLPPPRRRARQPSELDPGLDLHLRLGPAFNLYPNVAAAPRLRLSGHGRWAAAGIGATAALGGRFAAEEAGAQGSGRVDGGSVDLHACGFPLARQRWRVSACGNLGLGALTGRGVDVPTPGSATAPWLWSSAELGVSWWPRERVGLELVGELAVPFTRPSFHALDAQFTAGPVFGMLSLGVILNTWSRAPGAQKARTDVAARGQARAP